MQNIETPAEPTNPRFVLCAGAIREQFPDIGFMATINGNVTIWDRQEKRPAVTIHNAYCQAICLETNDHAGQPFTALERWLNGLSNETLQSEGITATTEEFRR